MRPAFAADPIAYTLFVCTVALWVIAEVLQSLRRRSNAASTDRYSLFGLRVGIGVGCFLATLALRLPTAALAYTPWVFGVGLLLTWTGIGLRWWSFWALGRYFTFSVMTSADQPVITSGPYRFLRHPSYAGVLLALVGIGVCLGNGLSLIALLVFPALGLVYRIRVEEAALSAALGDRYTGYASSRKRIIPFVW
jgi:protein-S-isoprenylcysteine O-methyltransferase Ste14